MKVRIDDIMVDITNFGQEEVFIADCLLIVKKKKKDKVCSILFPLKPRVVSTNDQKKEKKNIG